VGSPVTWEYVVSNTGNVPLDNVSVSDDQGVAVSCPKDTLAPGESMTCTGNGVAQLGQYANLGTATGEWMGMTVEDSDPSHYFGMTGRMSGGGSIFTAEGTRVTHGFVLWFDSGRGPNNLQVNWGKGHKFRLDELTSAECYDDSGIDAGQPYAVFDTYRGTGVGKYNGVHGAAIEWVFTDAGEPGKEDTAEITIWDPSGVIVLSVAGVLDKGNHQAHNE
jgi:hypothetical protein